ncbi:hypothetical protein A3715_32450 [Oleiphilus sp. HI0009]|nr:hypothetical protein A3715_11250 [Oleiphilus sp. HI0009]KZX83277.1 hypothetical protein A3715_32450 [Oleiphilus sp. HI0009]
MSKKEEWVLNALSALANAAHEILFWLFMIIGPIVCLFVWGLLANQEKLAKKQQDKINSEFELLARKLGLNFNRKSEEYI